MKKRKISKHNNVIILTITVIVLMMTSLTGCSKKPAANEASNPSAESTVGTKADETEKTTEEVSSEAASEPSVESNAEPIPEPVVYEGIDMESDLPGKEWVKTFIGVVDEPVVIIYNDSTGRKEIIQEGATVNVNPDDDRFAVYLPEGCSFSRLGVPTKTEFFDDYVIAKVDQTKVKEGTKVNAKATIKKGEEEIVTTFKVIIE